MFWCFFGAWVDNSWRVVWPYKPFDWSRSWYVWVNWHSWGVHLQSKYIYCHVTVFLNLSKLTFLFIKKIGFHHDLPSIIIFWFFLGRGWIIPRELYGLIDLLMEPNQGLYESIGVHELSNLNLKNRITMQSYFWIFQNSHSCLEKNRVPSDFPSVIIFWFFWGHGWIIPGELFGLTYILPPCGDFGVFFSRNVVEQYGIGFYFSIALVNFFVNTFILSHTCREKAHYMEKMVVCPYVKSFITSWSLHDLRGPNLCCQCGSY